MCSGDIMIKNFRQKTLGEITIWAWIAVVLPLSSLAALFFVWAFGWTDIYSELMVIGATTMFSVSVVWWWWAIWKIAQLVQILSGVNERFGEVREDLTHIKSDIKNLADNVDS